MELYNLDNRYKKFVETLVDGYVLGKSHMEDGSNPYISNPGIEVCNIFCDFTDNFLCNLIFHKENDKSINVCYVFDSRLINSEDGDRYEAEERFIKIKRADFIYKLTLLKWLEDSGYIVMIDDSNYNLFETGHITEHDRKKWANNGMSCVEEQIKSEFVDETLSRYHNCRIIPSAQLIDVRNKNFKTIEQRRFEKQTRLTWISILVALAIGILSPLISHYISNGNESITPAPTVDTVPVIKSADSIQVIPAIQFDTLDIKVLAPRTETNIEITPKK